MEPLLTSRSRLSKARQGDDAYFHIKACSTNYPFSENTGGLRISFPTDLVDLLIKTYVVRVLVTQTRRHIEYLNGPETSRLPTNECGAVRGREELPRDSAP